MLYGEKKRFPISIIPIAMIFSVLIPVLTHFLFSYLSYFASGTAEMFLDKVLIPVLNLVYLFGIYGVTLWVSLKFSFIKALPFYLFGALGFFIAPASNVFLAGVLGGYSISGAYETYLAMGYIRFLLVNYAINAATLLAVELIAVLLSRYFEKKGTVSAFPKKVFSLKDPLLLIFFISVILAVLPSFTGYVIDTVSAVTAVGPPANLTEFMYLAEPYISVLLYLICGYFSFLLCFLCFEKLK
ncbi:MAG: hypothetical protein E7623_07920 [Ruminococcaceae bacterium]|nr:hypothetical protein [Oscillospiraceae bacterium]